MLPLMLNWWNRMMMQQAELIINKYYNNNPLAKDILLTHSKLVRDKALWIADRNPHLGANRDVLELGSMLHDIGIMFTHAPEIGCNGSHPYICHGYLGRELLELEGLNKIALFAERHTGTGLTLQTIKAQNLPLPHREMVPVTIEEQIICFADKFYSKGKHPEHEIPLDKIRKKLAKHGSDPVEQFNKWCEIFL